MENFIRIYSVDKELCDNLIKYHKSNIEYKAEGQTTFGLNKDIKESIDVKFYNSSTDKIILNFFKTLSEAISKYLTEFQILYPVITDHGNLIQYYPKNGGYKVYHYENGSFVTAHRKFVYMLYLNDVKDGGTEFKYQNITLKAKKGNLVIWPGEFTHTHKGIISKTKEKYITTGWFRMRHLP
jgi:hypothetical protein